jgi:tetratricopeptide (TPR) repeat protein
MLALLLPASGAQTPVAPRNDRTPRTPADSMGAVIEPLFAAAGYDSILSLLPAYLRRAEATRDSVLLGRAFAQRGRVALMLGRREAAAADIDLGIRIAEAVRDTVGLMPAVHFKGFVYSMQGNYDEALRCFERRLDLALRTRSPADEAWARSSIGYVFHRRGDNVRARDEYTRAIQLFRASGMERLEITPLIGLGRVESAVGNETEAIRCYQRAWVVAKEVGDRVNEMWASNNLGALEATRGDLSRAALYQQRAFDLAKELKYPHGLVIPAANMADRALELGDFETCGRILDETRALCEREGAEEFLPMVDFRIALLQMEQGRTRSAAATFRELIASPEKLEPQHRDYTVLNLAEILASSDSTAAAIELLTRHLNQPQEKLYRDVIAPASLFLSRLYLEANEGEKALEYALRARAAAQSAGRRRGVITAMLRESVCRRALGQEGEATATFYAALDSLEAFRGGISTAEWREVYGQQVERGVVEAGRVLLEYPESAPQSARDGAFFDAMQRVKTRTLLDRITEPRFGADDIEGRWARRVATLADLQAVLAPGEAVLDFYVGNRRSFLAAVTRDSSRLVELPGPDSPLAERIQLFRTILANQEPSMREEYPVERIATIQRALGRDVLGGVADVVVPSSRLFVAADGYFAAIPFALLVVGDGADALLVARDVVQVPSASVLVLQRSVSVNECVSDARLVAIGSSDPALAGARNEVRDLARRYGGVDAVESLAGVESFETATDQCDVLHIAAHALVVDRSPWESGIRLVETPAGAIDAPADARPQNDESGILPAADSVLVAETFRADPYLRAWRIAQLDLPAKLAVLSACETGGGRATSGEGTLGITAAFLSAGVPVVVSSLWPIDDRVTADVMRSFYRHLALGEPVATSLRLAQLDVSRSRKHAHPFFWAGFTVVGDGSMVIDIEERGSRPRPAIIAALAAVVLVAVAAVIRRRRPLAPVG